MSVIQKISKESEFSIGNEKIDEDHMRLIEIYNEMVDLIDDQKGREDFAAALSGLSDFAFAHFKREEAYMKSFGYPDYEKHRKMHGEFMFEIATFNYRLFDSAVIYPEEVAIFIRCWLYEHIMVFDKAFEQYKISTDSQATYEDF